ncbi:MAG: hypothetical protein ACLFQK_07495 [Fibrobacterota bacterium]
MYRSDLFPDPSPPLFQPVLKRRSLSINLSFADLQDYFSGNLGLDYSDIPLKIPLRARFSGSLEKGENSFRGYDSERFSFITGRDLSGKYFFGGINSETYYSGTGSKRTIRADPYAGLFLENREKIRLLLKAGMPYTGFKDNTDEFPNGTKGLMGSAGIEYSPVRSLKAKFKYKSRNPENDRSDTLLITSYGTRSSGTNRAGPFSDSLIYKFRHKDLNYNSRLKGAAGENNTLLAAGWIRAVSNSLKTGVALTAESTGKIFPDNRLQNEKRRGVRSSASFSFNRECCSFGSSFSYANRILDAASGFTAALDTVSSPADLLFYRQNLNDHRKNSYVFSTGGEYYPHEKIKLRVARKLSSDRYNYTIGNNFYYLDSLYSAAKDRDDISFYDTISIKTYWHFSDTIGLNLTRIKRRNYYIDKRYSARNTDNSDYSLRISAEGISYGKFRSYTYLKYTIMYTDLIFSSLLEQAGSFETDRIRTLMEANSVLSFPGITEKGDSASLILNFTMDDYGASEEKTNITYYKKEGINDRSGIKFSYTVREIKNLIITPFFQYRASNISTYNFDQKFKDRAFWRTLFSIDNRFETYKKAVRKEFGTEFKALAGKTDVFLDVRRVIEKEDYWQFTCRAFLRFMYD